MKRQFILPDSYLPLKKMYISTNETLKQTEKHCLVFPDRLRYWKLWEERGEQSGCEVRLKQLKDQIHPKFLYKGTLSLMHR